MLEFALLLLLMLVTLLMVGWPLVALAAAAFAGMTVPALVDARSPEDRPGALKRAGRRLAVAAALTAAATYGYGLRSGTFLLLTDHDDRCAIARPDLYPYEYEGPQGGTTSMWPLHDTTCGPDLVPDFVNPLVAGAVLLFLALVVTMGVCSLRSRRSRRRPGPGRS